MANDAVLEGNAAGRQAVNLTLHGAADCHQPLKLAGGTRTNCSEEIPTEKIGRRRHFGRNLPFSRGFAVVLDENSSTNDRLEKLWKSRDPLEDDRRDSAGFVNDFDARNPF